MYDNNNDNTNVTDYNIMRLLIKALVYLNMILFHILFSSNILIHIIFYFYCG